MESVETGVLPLSYSRKKYYAVRYLTALIS